MSMLVNLYMKDTRIRTRICVATRVCAQAEGISECVYVRECEESPVIRASVLALQLLFVLL